MAIDQGKAALLWKDFANTKNMETRNQLVMLYVQLVKSIVCRMVPTYRKHVDFDDLMSCGLLGLMDAIDKFDPGREIKFETYASLRIKGEIIDQIRKQDWAPNSLRQKIKRIEDGFASLENKLGRSVSEKEVAEHLSMNEDDVKKALDESHTFQMMNLDDMLADRLDSGELQASSDDSPEESYENKELKEILAACIDKLGEREKLVVSLYYYDELTLREIGEVMGVTESRVSQIHSKAMMSLRRAMTAATTI